LGTAPVKDRAYVAWKYFDWPHLRTTVYGVEDGRSLRGFVALREPESPAEPGRILDIVAAPDDDAAWHGLIARALSHFRARKSSRVECMGTSPAVAAALARFFFVERPPQMPLFFLNAHRYQNPDHLRRRETWCHAFGDSEGGEQP